MRSGLEGPCVGQAPKSRAQEATNVNNRRQLTQSGVLSGLRSNPRRCPLLCVTLVGHMSRVAGERCGCLCAQSRDWGSQSCNHVGRVGGVVSDWSEQSPRAKLGTRDYCVVVAVFMPVCMHMAINKTTNQEIAHTHLPNDWRGEVQTRQAVYEHTEPGARARGEK